MFKKLVSNLPFSPSLIAQLGFYAQRLKKEQWMRRLGLIFTVFALVIQSFAIFSPPESANAASANDMCPGGTAAAIRKCAKDTKSLFRKAMNHYGITVAEVEKALSGGLARRYTKDYGSWWSHGRKTTSCKDTKVFDGLYRRKFSCVIKNYLPGWKGTSARMGTFLILQGCGNLVTRGTTPTPPPKPAYNLIKSGPTTAKPGATVTYTLTFKNTGKVKLTNVVVKDVLPKNVTYVAGSLKAEPATGVTELNNLFGSGAKISSVAIGASVKFTFNAQMPTEDKLVCGANKFTNTSSATTKEDTSEDSTTDNSVTTTVDKECLPAYDVIKTVDKATAKPGETLTYTITVKNTGKVNLTNIILTDTLPNYIASQTVSANVATSGDLFGSGLKIASLAVGGQVVITVKAVTKPAGDFPCVPQTLTNTVASRTDQTSKEDNNNNNKADTVVSRACAPGMDLEKKVDKTVAKPGETLNYTLTFRNLGNTDLSNIVVKDTLPAGLTLVGSSIKVNPGAGVTDIDKLFTTGIKIAKVATGGAPVVITFSAKVPNGDALKCGENKFTNTSVATAIDESGRSVRENTTSNNNAETTVTARCSYNLIKTVDKTAVKPGETLKYTLSLVNTGEVPLTNAVVKDQLPNGLAYNGDIKVDPNTGVSGDLFGGGLVIARVAAGQTINITFSVKTPAKNALKCGENTFTNKSSAVTNEDNTEDDTTDNDKTTTVNRECLPAYDVEKTVDKTVAEPGDTLTYKIKVNNTGEVDLTNIVLVDTLPDYIASKTVTVPTGVATSGDLFGNGLKIAKLAVGQSVEITIKAVVKSYKDFPCTPVTLTNTIASSTDQTGQGETDRETNNNNNITNTVVSRACAPSMDLEKTVDKTEAKPGEALNYTLTFRNLGNTDLSNVVITDTLPDNVTYNNDVKVDPNTGVSGDLFGDGLKIASVPEGKNVTITFSVAIAEVEKLTCGITELPNAATVTADKVEETTTENNQVATIVTRECESDIIQDKHAINNSQGSSDATTVTANGGDVITFTVTATNFGTAADTINLTDNLSDALEYATLTDNGGGVYDDASRTLSWNDVAVEPDATVERSFTMTINNPVPAMAQNVGSAESYDCTIVNAITNDQWIKIPINCPPAKQIIEQTIVKQLPATGPGENIIFGGIVAAIVVFFYARSRQLGKEVRLVRREFNTGTL